MIDIEILKTLIINSNANALGAQAAGPIAQYLSIFAGLLMFDDVRNIVQDASSNINDLIDRSDGVHVHLYLLNNVYWPGSYILTAFAEGMGKAFSEMDLKNIARVRLDTAPAAKIIDKYYEIPYGSRGYTLGKWDDKAEEIADASMITVFLLKNFINLLINLDDYL